MAASATEQLFACTNCRSKVSFEDLSATEQLCKPCRKLFPIAQCCYCRLEYHKTGPSDKSKWCKACATALKQFGEPKRCSYCTQNAAFQGHKCGRCLSSEKKYGSPVICEQCKLKCAFERPQNQKEKVDGKTLCFLCTMNYKKVKHREQKRYRSTENPSEAKRIKLESDTSKVTTTIAEVTGTDYVVETEKLRDQVSTLRRQVAEKDRLLLEKDKKISELQGEALKRDKEVRAKAHQQQKEHVTELESLQSTVRDLRKQLAQGAKTSRATARLKERGKLAAGDKEDANHEKKDLTRNTHAPTPPDRSPNSD